MASSSFTQLPSLPRWHSKWTFFPSTNIEQPPDTVLHYKWRLMAVSRKENVKCLGQGASEGEVVVGKKSSRTSNRTPDRSRKKVTVNSPKVDFVSAVNSDVQDEENKKPSVSDENSKKTRGARRKVETASSKLVVDNIEKKVTRRGRTKEKVVDTEDDESETELSDLEGDFFMMNMEDEFDEDLELGKDGEDDISFTYGLPPLVCCFGAAQHAFVPSGRPANRLINYKQRERLKDLIWDPENFVRAPGGCASNVAVALAILGGKAAFMGKVGNDEYGDSLLYLLNTNNVQTRSVSIDNQRLTAVSKMKIGKRGDLRMKCVKPCAEDSLSKSEINIDVLREANMFYFNTFSLLDRSMRSTTLQAIKISKKLGGLIFYDLNLPLPLWQSCEETKRFIQQAWNLADVIEVTKQEVEFLCGIEPSEKFDTKNNDRSKFVHHAPELLVPIWHENLKVLFVTNGTSMIHYYTKEHNGAVRGTEDVPLSPFSCDMSVSGDGTVAALMRMLAVQPHRIDNKGYLERTVKYAISCGVIDTWHQTRTLGFPPKEGMEENVEADPNGIRSLTDREYRTLEPAPLVESVLEEDMEEDVEADPDGRSSLHEREYRTRQPARLI